MIIKELLDVFRSEDPDAVVRDDVVEMLELAHQLVTSSGARFFSVSAVADKDEFYAKDQRINALQQRIRKHLVGRLELSTATERARFLVTYGLIKDIERLGDYAKNLLETAEMLEGSLEGTAEGAVLRSIALDVEEALSRTRRAFETTDESEARPIMQKAVEVGARCEDFIKKTAQSDRPASLAVPLALAARHYKRVVKHLANALSTLVMPLHKIDYFD